MTINSAADFMDRFVCALRERGVPDQRIHSLVTDRTGELSDWLAGAAIEMLAKCVSKVYGVFQVTLEGNASAPELFKRGQYWNRPVVFWGGQYWNGRVTEELFPLKPHDDAVSRSIELIECTHEQESVEVLAELARRGLERPTYEDALYFGVQHPEEQRKRPIVFLHEPWFRPDESRIGYEFVLGMDSGGMRTLKLEYNDFRWDRACVFAGVRA